MATLGMLDSKMVSLLWADPGRASAVANMHAALFEKPWDTEAMKSLLANPGAMSLIAKVRNDIPSIAQTNPREAGFVLAQIAADEAEVISIGVLEEFQGRGLAHIMMKGLIRAASIAEVKRLFLEVAEDNRPARRLYDGLNFSEVGRRAGYYKRSSGATADALILARDLDKSEE